MRREMGKEDDAKGKKKKKKDYTHPYTFILCIHKDAAVHIYILYVVYYVPPCRRRNVVSAARRCMHVCLYVA